jgi:GNAT superfamily N-acetyltransferase
MTLVRTATADDLPRLPDIERSAAQAFVGTQHGHLDLSHATPADDWRNALAAGTLWVIDGEDGRPVAFVGTRREADGDLHVYELDVELGRQSQGLGRALMTHAIAWARYAGCGGVTLTTFNDIAWNAPFYASMGFRILGRADRAPRLDAILAAEEARHRPGSRCAMRLDLTA